VLVRGDPASSMDTSLVNVAHCSLYYGWYAGIADDTPDK
jgi:hypothetical protein